MPIHLIYSKTNEILQIDGTNKAYWAILDSSNPLENGVYDLEIPYEPHHRYGEYYEKYSIKAQEVHKDRWNDIYNFLIGSRKGDSLSVGTLEIGD